MTFSRLPKVYSFGILIICLSFLSSCQQEFLDLVPLSVDHELGQMTNSQIAMQDQVFPVLDPKKYPKLYQHVELIRNRILNSGKVEHAADFNWNIHIINEDSVLNAFCVPAGDIYIYSGLIRYLKSEDALAGVMAHEIAHADQRHGTLQMLQNSGLSLLFRLIFGSDSEGLSALGINLISLNFSRADELQADEKSVEYLYPTIYDARGTEKFFLQLQKDPNQMQMIEFLSTHPNPENRIEKIESKWKHLGSKVGKTNQIAYQQLLKELPSHARTQVTN